MTRIEHDATGEHEGAGRRERNKADKRDRILRAATKLFNERGFEATTTSEIARAAGIGTGTLFLYTRSKEDLLVWVFREEVGRAWEDAFARVDASQPLIDQIRSAFGDVIEYHEHDPGLARAFLKELLFVGEPARAGASEFMRGFLRRLDALLLTAQERGALSPDVPTRTLAMNLFALYYTHIQRRHSGHLDAAELHAQLGSAFELQLRGLVPDARFRPATPSPPRSGARRTPSELEV